MTVSINRCDTILLSSILYFVFVFQFAEFENTTIQKQRQEMQLLVVELRSRDKELNEMVADHRKQLLAWEQDRNRIAALEEKCCCYESKII